VRSIPAGAALSGPCPDAPIEEELEEEDVVSLTPRHDAMVLAGLALAVTLLGITIYELVRVAHIGLWWEGSNGTAIWAASRQPLEQGGYSQGLLWGRVGPRGVGRQGATVLHRDGTYEVYVGPKFGYGLELVYSADVNERR
jgi:hypothetical protein